MLEQCRRHFRSAADVVLFLRIIAFVATLPVRIRRHSIPDLMRQIVPAGGNVVDSSKGDADKIMLYTDYVLGLKPFQSRNRCLKRSLTLYRFLRELGQEVCLCLGVRYDDEGAGTFPGSSFAGHAWITQNGKIIMEQNPEITETYKVTYCYPDKIQAGNY